MGHRSLKKKKIQGMSSLASNANHFISYSCVVPILSVFCMLPSLLPFIFVCLLFVGLFVCLFLFAVSLIEYLIVS